jgi:hypothetical protein
MDRDLALDLGCISAWLFVVDQRVINDLPFELRFGKFVTLKVITIEVLLHFLVFKFKSFNQDGKVEGSAFSVKHANRRPVSGFNVFEGSFGAKEKITQENKRWLHIY